MCIKSTFIKLRQSVIVFAILGMLLTVFSFETNAQDSVSGSFVGQVVDSKNNYPIEGVSIRIRNEDTGVELTTQTDKDGRFKRVALMPGLYTIQFSAEGYQSNQVTQALLATKENVIIPVPFLLEPSFIPISNVTGGSSVFVFRNRKLPSRVVAKPSKKPVSKNTQNETPKDLLKSNIQSVGALVVGSIPNTTIIVEASDKSATYKNVILADQFLAAFDQIPAQKYTVTAILEGYRLLKKEIDISPNKIATISLNLSPNESSSRILNQVGKYYALVIGGNNYQFFSQLKTAETDAKAVDKILREKYEFETNLLLNPTREQIIVALNEYRRRLDQNSNLLIYYAGHGLNDKEAGEAYWLPVNARQEDNANWISADDITRNIRAIPAKHILVVSDSCYSGALSRSSDIVSLVSEPTARERYLLKMSEGKSRTLLASGGNEPVLDGGGGIHSVFANAFLIGLIQPEKEIFTAEELYLKSIKESVAGKANQNPEYSAIRNSGHESGGFIFIRKK